VRDLAVKIYLSLHKHRRKISEMKRVINRLCVLAIFQTSIVSSLHAAPFGPTAGDLYASCSAADATNAAYCIGYLKAYRDWYQLGKDQLIGQQHQHCEPDNIDYRDFQQALVVYVKAHPEIQDEPRLVGVTEALHEAWPCPDFHLQIVQTLLPLLGYEIGNTKGQSDEKTIAAIEAFQNDNNLGQGLSVDALLEQILNSIKHRKSTLKQN